MTLGACAARRRAAPGRPDDDLIYMYDATNSLGPVTDLTHQETLAGVTAIPSALVPKSQSISRTIAPGSLSSRS
jgi:hypothetical protein